MRSWSWVLVTLLLPLGLTDPQAHASVGVRFEGGTILPYEAPGEVGNGAQGLLTLDLGAVELALGIGIVLPASDVAASLPAGQLLCHWHPWRGDPWTEDTGLSPYLTLGGGLAGSDTPDDDEGPEAPEVRWVSGEPEPLLLLGLGATFGPREGLYLTAELRAVNLSHLATLLGVGHRF